MNKLKMRLHSILLLCLVFNIHGKCDASILKSTHHTLFSETSSRSESISPNLNRILIKCRHLLLSDTAYALEQSFRLTDDIIYTTDAAGYLKSMNPEGYWSDLDYQSQERNAWPPSWHLSRLMLLCRAWHRTNQIEYLQAVHQGLAYWMKHDFMCDNWWHNQIYIPFTYISIMIMLDKEALPSELAYLDNVISKRVPQKNPTGQNKLWQHDIEARLALIHNDPEAFRNAIDGMNSLVVVGSKEGIQPDYSYHQHGAMLQFGNYGFHFLNSLLFWMSTTAKTEFAFGADKEKILFDYCSNGLRWTIFDKGMDLTAIGRQLRFNCDLKRGMDLNSNFNLIQSSYPVDACSFNLDGFDTDKSKQCTLVGNRGFWRSDYMVYLKGNNYMMSVKSHGEYVKKIESINSENLKGSFLNDGVSLIQSNGKEYRNIEPLWNWTMLPGTTCDTTIDPGSSNTFKTNNQSQFVGQVSDGTSGISAMDYNRSTVRAHKSYFFTDNLMVALGSGIGSANAKNLVTTINQRFLNHHKVYTSTSQFKTNRWIWHDSIAYIFPGNQTPIVRTEWRTGEWNKVDMVSKTATAKDSILSIFLPQSNNDSYAYIVKPACPLEGITKITEQKDMKILSNTPDVQAIQSKSLVMAVFYNSSLLKVPNGEMIRVNHPCILLYKHDDKKRKIWISDPTRKLATVQILIDGKSYDITLPSGDYAGSTLKTFFPE